MNKETLTFNKKIASWGVLFVSILLIMSSVLAETWTFNDTGITGSSSGNLFNFMNKYVSLTNASFDDNISLNGLLLNDTYNGYNDGLIRNSNGKYWSATGANIQNAIDEVHALGGGSVWNPGISLENITMYDDVLVFDTVNGTIYGDIYSSRTFYVSNTDGLDSNSGLSESYPWKTTTKVNSAMTDGTIGLGDNILFKCGDTFTGDSIEIKQGGNTDDYMIFGSYGSGVKPILDNGASQPNLRIATDDEVNYLKIEDINISRSGNNGIACTANASYIEINDCDFYESEIYLDAVIDYQIENCDFFTSGGITLYGDPYERLSNGYVGNCSIIGNGSLASEDLITIHHDGSYNNVGSNHYIYNCDITGATEDCIDLTAGSDVLVESCECSDWGNFGISIGSDIQNLTVQYNYIHDDEGSIVSDMGGGINLGTSDNVMIRYNVIYNVSDESSLVIATSTEAGKPWDGYNHNQSVYNNYFVHPATWGHNTNRMMAIQNDYFDNIFIKNNVFADFSGDTDRFINENVGAQPIPPKTGITWDSNIYWNSDDYSGHIAYNGSWVDITEWQTYYANDSFDDPEFNSDSVLSLNSTSPCIDAGTNLTKTIGEGIGFEVTVDNACYFTDGFGYIVGDSIRIGSHAPAIVLDVNYENDILTLDRPISWASGDTVNLDFNGDSQDIGVFEYFT